MSFSYRLIADNSISTEKFVLSMWYNTPTLWVGNNFVCGANSIEYLGALPWGSLSNSGKMKNLLAFLTWKCGGYRKVVNRL